jgi:sulfur carrier protein
MNILFNGESRLVRDQITIAELLIEMKLDSRRIAVEVNLELAPRDHHSKTILQEDDQLEVVTLVGGG